MARCLLVLVSLLGLSHTAMSRRIKNGNMVKNTKIDAMETHATASNGSLKVNNTMSWIFDHVKLGEFGGPLIPALVPGPGDVYEVMVHEALDLIETNEYHWQILSKQNVNGGPKEYIDQWFAASDGDFFDNFMGYKTTVIRGHYDGPLFKIHLAKHMWNPTRLSWSFRISNPYTDEILYTINKDWVGSGFMWLRDEWRVYRGRKRDGNQVYYGVSSYFGFEYYFYRNKNEWLNNRPPRATSSQSIVRSLPGVPDVFTLKVQPGEDTALLLAISMIHDMVYEQEDVNRAVHSARRERHNEGRRQGKGGR